MSGPEFLTPYQDQFKIVSNLPDSPLRTFEALPVEATNGADVYHLPASLPQAGDLTENQIISFNIGQLALGALVAGRDYVEKLGKGIYNRGKHVTLSFTRDAYVRIKSDLKTFQKETKRQWTEAKDKDKETIHLAKKKDNVNSEEESTIVWSKYNARIEMVGVKVFEIFTKPIIKLIEYPAAAVLGGLGAIIYAKKGKEIGQKAAIKIGEGLWSATMGIGKRGWNLGRSLIYDVVVRYVDDVMASKKIFKKMEQDLGEAKEKDWKVKAEIRALTFFEFIVKPFIKVIEYPAAAVLGALGAIIYAKEGREYGQKAATKVGEGLWSGALGIAKRVWHLGKSLTWDIGVRVKADLKDFDKKTRKDWYDAKVADQETVRLAREANEDLAKKGDEKADRKTPIVWSKYNARIEMVGVKLFEIFTKPITKLIEYPAAGILGAFGAIFYAKKGKEFGQEAAIKIGEGLWTATMGIGKRFWHLGRSLTWDIGVRIKNDLDDLISFGSETKKQWVDAKETDQKTQLLAKEAHPRKIVWSKYNARIEMVGAKVFEILIKPITKLIEYPAAIVLGPLGAIINAKDGKEFGQKAAIQFGKGLWSASMGIAKRGWHLGRSLTWDIGVRVKEDLIDFINNTMKDWAISENADQETVRLAKEKVGGEPTIVWSKYNARIEMVGAKAFEIFIKPITKLIEYPAAAVFGAMGAIIYAKEGKEYGQMIATGIGEGLWSATIGIAKRGWHLGRSLTWDVGVRLKKDLETFRKKTETDWEKAIKADLETALLAKEKEGRKPTIVWSKYNARIEMVGAKVFEIITKPLTKLIEYPAAAVLGGFGAIIYAKEGKEFGQEAAIKIGEGLWTASMGIAKRVWHLGRNLTWDVGVRLKNDLEAFGKTIEDTKKDWSEARGNARAKAGIVVLKTLEFFVKPFTKLVAYPAAIIFGALGAIIYAKEGKEFGQQAATKVGEGLWSAACFIGRAVKVIPIGIAKRFKYLGISIWELGVRVKDDLKNFDANTRKDWKTAEEADLQTNDPWSKYNARTEMIALKAFEIIGKPITKLIEYPAALVLGSLGAIIYTEEGKKLGQKAAIKIGEGLWAGACYVSRPFKKRGFATVGVGLDAVKGVFSDISRATVHFSELKGKISAASKARAFGIIAIEVLSWPATMTFTITKFALCGSLGLAGAIISGKKAKEKGYVLSKMIAYFPHFILASLSNLLSKHILGEELSIVKSRNREIIKMLDSTQRGHKFLVKYCGYKGPTSTNQQELRKRVDTMKEEIVKGTEVIA